MLLCGGRQSPAATSLLPPVQAGTHLYTWEERSKLEWRALLKDTTSGPTWGSNSRPWDHESRALPLSLARIKLGVIAGPTYCISFNFKILEKVIF